MLSDPTLRLAGSDRKPWSTLSVRSRASWTSIPSGSRLFMRIQQMGLPETSKPAQPARGSVLDMDPQGDPLQGKRKGVVDFSMD